MSAGLAWRVSASVCPAASTSNPRAIHRIVDEQIRLWDALSTHRKVEPQETTAAPHLHFPAIAISRTFGAKGIQVAKLTSDMLQFSLWGRELVNAVARQIGATLNAVTGLDERCRTGWEDFVDTIMNDAVPQQRFAEVLFEVVRSVARMGSAVIVGRGAQFLVEPAHALRVRITAPLELRVSRYGQKHELSHKEAERVVRATDMDRDRFTRHYFLADAADQHNYDLCINTANLSVPQSCNLVLSAYDAKFPGLIDLATLLSRLHEEDLDNEQNSRSSIPAPAAEFDGIPWPRKPTVASTSRLHAKP